MFKKKIFFLCLIFSFSAFSVSVRTKYSATPIGPSYIFSAGTCSFPSGDVLSCHGQKMEAKLARLLDISVSNVLAEIREECTWFDILDVEPLTESKNKRDLFDQDGNHIGNYAEKHFKAKVKFLCETPIS